MEAVTLELGGRKRTLALDLNSVIAIRKLTGQDPIILVQRMGTNGQKGEAEIQQHMLDQFDSLRALVWATVLSDNDCELAAMDPRRSLALVGSWMEIDKLNVYAETLMPVITSYAEKLSKKEFPEQLAPYVASPDAVVTAMIEMGNVRGKVVYDLGAGDGRVIHAAMDADAAHARAYEMHPARYDALKAKYANTSNVFVFRKDIREASLVDAQVVFLYLLPGSNEELYPKLIAELSPGAVVISHDFDFKEWQPVEVRTVQCPDKPHRVYKFIR